MTDSKKPNFGIRFQNPATPSSSVAPASGVPSAGVSFRIPAMQPPAPALPDDAQACNTQGNAWLQANRAADAIRAYDRAIALRADYLDPHFNRGNALLRLGRNAEALAAFEKAIALAPGLALAHYNRGTVLEGMGREQEAMDSYRWVLLLEPEHVQALFNLGCLHLRSKAYDEAVRCMDRVLAKDPRLAQ
ncbi:MAG: tetratricopeptide repeat protein, partial [Proteobacteria bacterium]|nr:tetratricopeptide repeat protein [Pseudomonadota bacterium]